MSASLKVGVFLLLLESDDGVCSRESVSHCGANMV